MPSAFEMAWAARQGALAAAFDEWFILEPQAYVANAQGRRDVNAPMAPSPMRPGFQFSGTFVAAGSFEHAHGRRIADNATHTIASERPMIDVAQAAMIERPREGDRVRRLSDDRVFVVTAYLPEAPVRAWIYLAEGERRLEDPR